MKVFTALAAAAAMLPSAAFAGGAARPTARPPAAPSAAVRHCTGACIDPSQPDRPLPPATPKPEPPAEPAPSPLVYPVAYA